MKMYSNIFYFANINSIGGVESFFYYLVKKYKDIDITIIYKTGDKAQLDRLKKYVRVRKYERGKIIRCEKAFFNYAADIIDFVYADEYIQIIHADYKAQKIMPHINDKITKYVGVSQLACDSFIELTGKPCELIYNPIVLEKPKKVLNLISATRLTQEKGRSRMIKLGEILDKAGIPYIWTIFTNDNDKIHNPNIVYMEPKLDISNYIANADYLVQLSDCESYCYSIVESLSLGTPIIATDLPVLKELGIENGKHGFIVDFDMENVDVDAIYKGLENVSYKPKKDTWDKMLVNRPSTYADDLNKKYLVEATDRYARYNVSDLDLGFVPELGYRFVVGYDRLEVLTGDNDYGEEFVELIEEVDDNEQSRRKTNKV